MSDESTGPGHPGAFETIVYGGLVVGIFDFLDATIFFMTYASAPFQRIWQGVASGVLGREASVSGGWPTATLGIFLHFAVAFSIAAVYYLLSRNIPLLIRRPVVSGLIFGVIANVVMQWVIIPLSAIGYRPPAAAIDWGVQMNSYVGHSLVVGLPLALIAAWSARKRN